MTDAEHLIAELIAARSRTRRVADDLGGAREFGPLLSIVNPPRWELGHVAWFQEYWCLRRSSPDRFAPQRRPSILPHADALYNSATVPHDARWDLPLPEFGATLAYRDRVLARLAERLRSRCDADDAYFAQLAARHEEMHAEAFHYTRQTLAYPAPAIEARPPQGRDRIAGDVAIPGGTFELGAAQHGEFAFDNEQPGRAVTLQPYRIARTPVTNAEFAAFVEAGGYEREEFWGAPGRRWLRAGGRRAPLYWRHESGGWQMRRFDCWQALAYDEPAMHVCWYEAEAYCRYAGRRLPTEAEWEFAATWDPGARRKRRFSWGDEAWRPGLANLTGAAPGSVHACPEGDGPWGLRQQVGNVWEWTASDFLPYPGFAHGPYREYSEPWFGTHKVLRGGSFASSASLAHATFRNFYLPERADVFAGFRTCALEAR